MSSTSTMTEPSPLQATIRKTILEPCGISFEHNGGARKHDEASNDQLPFVTVTWAQTLDGRVSGPNGNMMAISCPEAFIMTHMLRATHDGILVGVGTVKNDNPRLTVRLTDLVADRGEPVLSDLLATNHPQPIVLDPRLSLPETCHLVKNPTCRRPWIVFDPKAAKVSDAAVAEKAKRLVTAGCKLIPVANARHDLHGVLRALRVQGGMCSIMVEGGRAVLESFLTAQPSVANAVIITIAPRFVGSGVHLSPSIDWTPTAQSGGRVAWHSLGDDAIMIWHRGQ
ncbi:riboflavin-specific deaminase domain-containing protein [Allomyces macrogynus ATCC 38327]|uniref:2,5-diamino-6-ribosylamino-4(3H)-pyrimidinone 5'-phosphate reductase n=1 Tax=Allomyces macrogynus (strain ATCC 38327) TaxID=578462 RepID=A0A0L0SZ43_ALLM3|nr:riboflavin-specific deaminase domain-containing protein [Allomyces macrogynus ATCC 38327]|eukprot:KNE67579.1 riboflavin-specific deaminase domain-containing protein [Allomyces macrogynus ATCC 38327]